MPLLSYDEIVRLIEARRFDLIEHHHLAVDRLIQDVIKLGQTPKESLSQAPDVFDHNLNSWDLPF